MTNAKLLRRYIEKSGYKRKFVAEKIGLTYQGYLYKESGKNEFNQSEIEGLCELLSIPLKDKERIFFCKESRFTVYRNVKTQQKRPPCTATRKDLTL